MILKEIRREVVKWIDLAQDNFQLQTSVNTVMDRIYLHVVVLS